MDKAGRSLSSTTRADILDRVIASSSVELLKGLSFLDHCDSAGENAIGSGTLDVRRLSNGAVRGEIHVTPKDNLQGLRSELRNLAAKLSGDTVWLNLSQYPSVLSPTYHLSITHTAIAECAIGILIAIDGTECAEVAGFGVDLESSERVGLEAVLRVCPESFERDLIQSKLSSVEFLPSHVWAAKEAAFKAISNAIRTYGAPADLKLANGLALFHLQVKTIEAEADSLRFEIELNSDWLKAVAFSAQKLCLLSSIRCQTVRLKCGVGSLAQTKAPNDLTMAAALAIVR